jgi:hypothetical protein
MVSSGHSKPSQATRSTHRSGQAHAHQSQHSDHPNLVASGRLPRPGDRQDDIRQAHVSGKVPQEGPHPCLPGPQSLLTAPRTVLQVPLPPLPPHLSLPSLGFRRHHKDQIVYRLRFARITIHPAYSVHPYPTQVWTSNHETF